MLKDRCVNISSSILSLLMFSNYLFICLLKVAAWAFSVLVSNTGYVVQPHIKHPDLMELLFTLLRRVESKSIQAEVILIHLLI